MQGSFLLYFLFFCSGVSGLIYQVVWVRVFGNVFGNTVHSAALIVAVFMLGLGAGGYLVGVWADRRYAAGARSLLRAYGAIELLIAAIGFGISLILPRLGGLAASLSWYVRDGNGWYVVSPLSYATRTVVAVVLLTPITLLMGGTLTLLIRHVVGRETDRGRRRIAILYGVNTAGAALGCVLTDFALVQAVGLSRTQLVAVGLNLLAGAGAFRLARRAPVRPGRSPHARFKPQQTAVLEPSASGVAVSLAMIGCAAMGMEILWFRHFTILLGGFRAVFSLLLAIILLGTGTGALLAGLVDRRRSDPASWLMIAQALFVAFTLLGLATSDASRIEAMVRDDPFYQRPLVRSIDRARHVDTGWRLLYELWFNARPMLLEIGLPVLLMGFSFPLANAAVRSAEPSVGRRAGVLYLANTAGAVCGSLATGFVMLPAIGIQASATVLCSVAALAIVPLQWAPGRPHPPRELRVAAVSVLAAAAAVTLWARLPSDHVITRALANSVTQERVLVRREGLTEVVEVTELAGQGRRLLTNGHPMSATSWLSQRYMRALAHLPLLAIDDPQRVLVIGFGVGNTTHAATLHQSIRRVDVADLSRDILSSAGYFAASNGDAVHDPRVSVFVNDGRQHLRMQPPASYDLITLEPPPIGYAGVAALYSREFYELARARLTGKGYISQWLPAYQVPPATTLSMVRAFVEVFPRAVLVSGAQADLLLIGSKDSPNEIDPARLAAKIASEPRVRADLQRLDLGSVREIVGTFVGSAARLADATRDAPALADDRPIQEYGVRSLLDFGEVPSSLVDLGGVAAWCPRCVVNGRTSAAAEGLDTYLALVGRAYAASPEEIARTRTGADRDRRLVAGSAYLGAVVPESADLHNVLGISHAEHGEIEPAIAEFRLALALDPGSAATEWHLGAALAEHGDRDDAVAHLRRSVELDPANALAREDLRALDPHR